MNTKPGHLPRSPHQDNIIKCLEMKDTGKTFRSGQITPHLLGDAVRMTVNLSSEMKEARRKGTMFFKC